MTTLLDEWLKVKNSGKFHRKWKNGKALQNNTLNVIPQRQVVQRCSISRAPNNSTSIPREDSNESTEFFSDERENWLTEMGQSSMAIKSLRRKIINLQQN